MRDQDGDAARSPSRRRADAGEPLEQRVLGLGVERRGRLVEHEQQRLVAHEAARERELLPLTERELDAVAPGRAELGVEAARQAAHHVAGAGALDRGVDRGRIVDARQVADADGLRARAARSG